MIDLEIPSEPGQINFTATANSTRQWLSEYSTTQAFNRRDPLEPLNNHELVRPLPHYHLHYPSHRTHIESYCRYYNLNRQTVPNKSNQIYVYDVRRQCYILIPSNQTHNGNNIQLSSWEAFKMSMVEILTWSKCKQV
ncbi:hypothetical protein BLOT_013081 [Blomia tropicalis]|nr:hypothetical protein BLOT_013081 [Blomia tropicalis]